MTARCGRYNGESVRSDRWHRDRIAEAPGAAGRLLRGSSCADPTGRYRTRQAGAGVGHGRKSGAHLWVGGRLPVEANGLRSAPGALRSRFATREPGSLARHFGDGLLSQGAASVIVATGIGSLLSDHLPIATSRRALAWSGLTVLYLVLLPFWLAVVVGAFEAHGIVVRAALALAMIAPAGLLMGFGFPTGMQLVSAIDTRPTPWFWAINGAAGVLAAGIAVAVSIAFSINACIWLGAACYLPLGAAATSLMNPSAYIRTDRTA